MTVNTLKQFNPYPHLKKYFFSVLIALFLSFTFWVHQSVRPIAQTYDVKEGITALYANQSNDDLTALFTTAIARAKESVLLIVYTLTDPSIIKALKEKSEEGVEVRIITDAKESSYITSKLGSSILMTRRFSEGRMHQKILVIDEKESWIGSANMTTESLRMHGNLVSATNSPSLAKRLREKALTMTVKTNHSFFSKEDFIIGDQLIELWFLPDDDRAVRRIKDMIESATKYIRVAMFTWTRMDFAQALVDAAKRGIDVEIVLDSNQGKGVSAKIVNFLKNNKMKISLSRAGPLLHHKFLYVDNMLVNGSANWTHDAFCKNDECFLVIHNLTQDQQKQMDFLWDVIKTESIPVSDHQKN